MGYRIPLNRPFLVGKELFYMAQSIMSGHSAGDGIFTEKCHNFMQEKFKAKKVLLTHSCTAALEMAAILCKGGPGDEVIVPSFTFVSTANAFYLRGAKIVFVDIHQDTLNMDERMIEALVTKRTKVVVPVHYAGVGCNMDVIIDLAHHYGFLVVEDAAQGVNATYKGKYLGTIGDLGTYSFHETKNVMCGEGGALVINDEKFIERAEIIREKGTNRSKFFRGEIDKYTWVDTGSSYLPSDLIAAFLFAQLENMEAINSRRRELFDYYYKALKPMADEGKFKLPFISDEGQSNHHLFYVILQDEKTRNSMMNHLKSMGILAVFHYIPLHLSPVGRSMGYGEGMLPVTEKIGRRILRLPFYNDLTHDEQSEVVDAIISFFTKRR